MDATLTVPGDGRRYPHGTKSAVNALTLKRIAYRYEVDGKPAPGPHYQTDYFVDGLSLGLAFRFESTRPWFGQTCFEYDDAYLEESVRQLRGLSTPCNQFGTERFVLYRCHCGDDNCGIISCGIQRIDNVVRWIDIRFEDDDGPTDDHMYDGCIPMYEFDSTAYDSEIAKFLKARG